MTVTAGQQKFFGVMMNEGMPLNAAADTIGQTSKAYSGELANAIQAQQDWADTVPIASLEGDQFNIESNGFNFILNNNSTSSGTAIIDVYTIKCIKDVAMSNLENPLGATDDLTIENYLEQLWLQTRLIGSSATSDMGFLPFGVKQFCQHFKIVKVQEVQIPAGDTVTLSMRSPKNFKWSYGKFVGKWYLRGLTQGYLFRARGAPDAAAVTGDALTLTGYAEYHTCIRRLSNNENFLATRDR
jgi:hypothetical protein